MEGRGGSLKRGLVRGWTPESLGESTRVYRHPTGLGDVGVGGGTERVTG